VVALIGLTFVVVLALVVQLREELRLLQEEPVDSLNWNVTQLELDMVRLEAEVRLVLATPQADLSPLRTRFDLFYNRAATVLEGAMFDRLGLIDVVAPMKTRMRDFLFATTPIIDGDDTSLRQAMPDIALWVSALRQDLRTMTIKVIDQHAAIQDARRTSLTAVLKKIALASGALVALLVALLALVRSLNRHIDRRSREIQRITSRLAATVGTALDAVIVAGLDGRVIDFNPAAETIFGYSRAEAQGQFLSQLIVPPHHRAAHIAGMERFRATGVRHVVGAGRMQITATRKSGEEFPVELSIVTSDASESPIFIAFLRDISDQKGAEAALVAARDEAQAAERAKTSFIAVMSHEMRTPLNGVIGALEVLSRTPLEPKQERFLKLAGSSAQQLLRHVNDVLEISRVDAGHATLLDDRFDMAALIATLVDPMRPAAAEKNTQIKVQLLNDFPPLQGDPFRIGQILQNFISNAIKFADRGIITVEAELQETNGARVEVELRVIDTGIGIAEADQSRIFEDFVMVDPSHGRSAVGTGLGLAISRRLARAMSGDVGVESELGEGSCFWLRLSLLSAVDTAEVSERQTAHRPSSATPSLDVLVVEDNLTNRIVLEEMLSHLGHRVTLAVDGGEGVEKARTKKFDRILMDLSMPQMDGWTAATLIRAGGASQDSPILAVTAHAQPDQLDRFAECGIDGWLAKPLSSASLTKALETGRTAWASRLAEASTRDTSEALVDMERLDDLRRIADKVGLERILKEFHADMERILTAIHDAAEAAPSADLAAVVHAGVGAAAVVGAGRLSRDLARLEAACLAGDITVLRTAHRGLSVTWRNTWAVLGAALGVSYPTKIGK
jgi:PAS domain S-box-containing protein